jgi:hypothetical protein
MQHAEQSPHADGADDFVARQPVDCPGSIFRARPRVGACERDALSLDLLEAAGRVLVQQARASPFRQRQSSSSSDFLTEELFHRGEPRQSEEQGHASHVGAVRNSLRAHFQSLRSPFPVGYARIHVEREPPQVIERRVHRSSHLRRSPVGRSLGETGLRLGPCVLRQLTRSIQVSSDRHISFGTSRKVLRPLSR